MLAVEVHGEGPNVALVHGFTQTGRSWGPVLARLGRASTLWVVDAPGHGGSSEVRTGLWDGARELVRSLGPMGYLGYSMGARLCLHAALQHPGRVQRLVLVSGTAGIPDARDRSRRRAADDALAAGIERAGDAGLPDFLRRWLAGPLFAGLDEGPEGMRARLENTAAGLASSLRLAGTGQQEPLHDRLGEIAVPTLLVVGERDEKFRREAEVLRAGIAGAEVVVVEGAGHACHLERPDRFCELVEPWLTATAPAPA